jgi:predicted signal transduction protein with EAL and GGDEF domain
MRLTSCVRRADTVARFGGDEFMVLLAEVGTVLDVEIVARKILAELNRPFDLEGRQESISGSIGITICPDDGSDIATLMNNADNVMYHAKESGRNSFKFFTEQMNRELQTRQQLSAALRTAIADNALDLEFQPLLALTPRRPVGAEALLRWHDREHGPIQPADVIALAEDTQLIEALGGWILDRACAAFVRLHAADARFGFVCINVSPRQFRTNFTTMLEQAVARHGLAANQLCLDLTETLIADDRVEVWEELERLKALGVRLMLDDFGSGISSLGHLKRLAPEAVKLQSAYLAGIVPKSSAAAMIGALIAMAHSLDIRVVVEGVEEASQAEMMELLGCDFAQGYLFSPPLALDDLIAGLRNGEFGSTGTESL